MLTQDKLWKAIFEDFFPEAVKFYFPALFKRIDWSRGFELLDKELRQIYPESEESHRRVDLLAKVWLEDGSEQWLLIHIEVQGYKDHRFPRRMFVYFYRLTDRFKVPVTALAVLTDQDLDWAPDKYHYRCFKTELTYKYPVYKLAKHTVEEFEKSKNPWALVMKTAFIGLKANWTDESLLQMKIALYRDLRKKNFSKARARWLLHFIKYYVRFGKSDFYHKFDEEITAINKNNSEPMGTDELVKKHLLEEAEKVGIIKGLEQGKQQGLEQGKQQGLEQGKQQGLEQGKQEGLQIGRAEQIRISMRGILNKYPSMTTKELAEIFAAPLEIIRQVRQEIQAEDFLATTQKKGSRPRKQK
jgi:predicted transposase YdaD